MLVYSDKRYFSNITENSMQIGTKRVSPMKGCTYVQTAGLFRLFWTFKHVYKKQEAETTPACDM